MNYDAGRDISTLRQSIILGEHGLLSVQQTIWASGKDGDLPILKVQC